MAPVRGWWRVQRLLSSEPRPAGAREPRLSVGDWSALFGPVLVVCHPDWRGVRTAAYAHGEPVCEVADAGAWAEDIAANVAGAGVGSVVVHGFPPGAGRLATALHHHGVEIRIVLHSSIAQHGAEASEVAVVDEVVALLDRGLIDGLGFVKEGQAEAFAAMGIAATWVPNRSPALPAFDRRELGAGRTHVGVFAEPFWRKNVVTQLAAVALMDGASAHVLTRPSVGYLRDADIIEHGILPWPEFVALQGSVDLNLYVTLSECYPLTPIESYRCGVPCLLSRTSSVFRDDPDLWEVTTVDRLDDPVAIAAAARALLEAGDEIVARAQRWIDRWDVIAAERWRTFVRHDRV